MFLRLFLLSSCLNCLVVSLRATSEPPSLVIPATHGSLVANIAFSPDSRWVLTGTSEGHLKLWDLASHTQARDASLGRPGFEKLVAILPRNGTQFYVVITRHIMVVETPSLRVLATIESQREIQSARASPDGEKLWLGGREEKKQYVLMLRRARFPLRTVMERTIDGAVADDWAVPDISPNGDFALAVNGPETEPYLLRLSDSTVLRSFSLPDSGKGMHRYAIGWTNDNRIAYSQVKNGTLNQIDVLNLDDFSVEATKTLSIDSIYSNFDPAPTLGPGTMLFASTGQLVFFDGHAWEGPFDIGQHPAITRAVSPDGRFVVIGTSEGEIGSASAYFVRSFDRANGVLSKPWSPPGISADVLAGSSRGDAFFFSDGRERSALVKFDSSGLHLSRIDAPRCFDARFSPKGDSLTFNRGSYDNRASIEIEVDHLTSQIHPMPRQYQGRGGEGNLILSPSGKLAADIHPSSPVEIYEPQTGTILATYPTGKYGYGQTTGSGAFSPDDSLFVYFTADAEGSTVRCVDLKTGETRWTKPKINYAFATFQFTPDGKKILALGIHWAPWLFVFDAATGEKLEENFLPYCEYSARAVFSPDGTQVYLPNGKDILVVDCATHQTVKVLSDPIQSAERLTLLGANRLVSSGADNAIRIWDLPSGTELGTLSFSGDLRDWAWLHPSGRFEATSGFQEQMYFMQGGLKVPLSAYSEAYYTPGLIAQAMAGQPVEAPTIEIKDLIQPPSISLTLAGANVAQPVDGKVSLQVEQASLKLTAVSPEAMVAEMRLYQNGKLVESRTRNLTVEDDKDDNQLGRGGKMETLTVALVPGENVFRAVAINEQRTESKPAELTIVYDAPKNSGRTGGGLQLHVLVVGIDAYKNPKYTLNYAVADATAVKDAIEKNAGAIFSKVNVTALFDENVTRAKIVEAFDTIARESGPRDAFVFFYAGHGVKSSDAKPEFFIVPYDLTQLYGADDQLRTKAISSSELLNFSQKIPAQKQLYLLDACQSAGALAAVVKRGAAEEKAVAQLARASGTHWITASGTEQFATEFEKLGHGTFTYALLEAFNGKAKTGDGRLTVNSLKAWLETEVPELTKANKGTAQYPASYGFGQDFPVAVVGR